MSNIILQFNNNSKYQFLHNINKHCKLNKVSRIDWWIHSYFKKNIKSEYFIIKLVNHYYILPYSIIKEIFSDIDDNLIKEKIFRKVSDYYNCYIINNKRYFDITINYLNEKNNLTNFND